MTYLGSWKIDDALTFVVNVHDPATGGATDADAVPAYRTYEDETATPILTGNMALLDSVNTAGFYSEQITLSAANGFEKGKSYNIYISAAVNTVTGSIGYSFQMEAEVDANIVSDKTGYGIASGGIAAAAFVAGAIDAAAIAADAIGASEIAADAITSSELATSAVNEIRDAILSDSTPFAGANVDAAITTRATPAQVNTEVDTALADVNLDHVAGTASGIPAIPAGTYLDQIMDDGTATFDRTTDSLQAIRDRGDTAWITGGGGGITDILNITPLVPISIDLADTATWRLGIMLINSLDDLPSTGEITPGTISIDRKAIGGTSWSAVVTDAACSEAAGLVYFDEVFDSGSAYAEGDSIRITFKSQKITVSANDYEISDATGRIFYTEVRQTERGTDSAALASVVGTPAGASVSVDIAAVQSDTDDIQTRLPSSLTTGTADSGTTLTMVDAALTEADTDYWAGLLIRFTSGTISGQTRLITGFTPASDTITFIPATTQAVGTNTYEFLPWGAVDIRNWNGTSPNNLVSGAVDADVSAIQAAAITAASIATDAITAAKIAADAITSSELATSAVNEIRDAILSDSMSFNGADIATILSDTDDIQTRLPAALVSGKMSSDAEAISGSTTAADRLEASALTIVSGIAQTGTLSVTQMTTDLTEVTDDHYIGRIIIWTSGVLQDQATDITDYVGVGGLLTYTAVTEAPSNLDTFIIV